MSTEQRLDRLEAVVHVLAEDQVKLQDLIARLAKDNDRRFDRVAEQFAETDRRIEAMHREMDRRFTETDRKFAETDRKIAETDRLLKDLAVESRRSAQQLEDRVSALVSAIGQMIPPGPQRAT